MSEYYRKLGKKTCGAWVIHHGRKTVATTNGSAEFPALDTAGKAASLLSQIAASKQNNVGKSTLNAFAKSAGLNPRLELPALLDILSSQRLIDRSANGGIEVLGLSSDATIQYAANIFESQQPTLEEQASIILAELTSSAPTKEPNISELISDEFRLTKGVVSDLLLRSERVGFVDAEGVGTDKIYFNGNLFRRNSISKANRVLDSLLPDERSRASEIDALLNAEGCVEIKKVEDLLGEALFSKLRAAGMYDINHVANPSGEFGFVTRPAAFHKYNDPLADDAFDLAKALVSALKYGMSQSASNRGRIQSIDLLLSKLIAGYQIGPATAIGEDYRVLETKGVIHVTPAAPYGYFMSLVKRDIGEMALAVLTTGDSSAVNAVDRPFLGRMEGYIGPKKRVLTFVASKYPQAEEVLSTYSTRFGWVDYSGSGKIRSKRFRDGGNFAYLFPPVRVFRSPWCTIQT